MNFRQIMKNLWSKNKFKKAIKEMVLYRYLKNPIMMEIIIDTLPSVVLKAYNPEHIRNRLVK